jgi:hypothetical protein
MDVDPSSVSVETELNVYMWVYQMSNHTDPLMWWKHTRKSSRVIPHLTRMTRQCLPVSVSSVWVSEVVVSASSERQNLKCRHQNLLILNAWRQNLLKSFCFLHILRHRLNNFHVQGGKCCHNVLYWDSVRNDLRLTIRTGSWKKNQRLVHIPTFKECDLHLSLTNDSTRVMRFVSSGDKDSAFISMDPSFVPAG